mgnify:CR=1 FL=1
MKKIVKQGRVDKNKTCTYCSCEFTFEAEDIKNFSKIIIQDGEEKLANIILKVECPECKVDNVINLINN